jgi:hypothetical protein
MSEFPICIVDNNSNDNSIDLINNFSSKYNQITFLKSHTNTGYASGNNIGMRWALDNGFSQAFIINPDISIKDKLVFQKCLETLNKCKNAMAVGPKINGIFHYPARPELLSFMFPFAHRFLERHYFESKINIDSNAIEVYKLYGCFLCLDLIKMRQLDFFDEETFLYFEESILSEKARSKNYNFQYIPDVSVDHISQGSVAQLGIRQFKYFFMSCFLYLHKYRGYSKISSFIFSGIDVFFRFIINSIRRII